MRKNFNPKKSSSYSIPFSKPKGEEKLDARKNAASRSKKTKPSEGRKFESSDTHEKAAKWQSGKTDRNHGKWPEKETKNASENRKKSFENSREGYKKPERSKTFTKKDDVEKKSFSKSRNAHDNKDDGGKHSNRASDTVRRERNTAPEEKTASQKRSSFAEYRSKSHDFKNDKKPNTRFKKPYEKREDRENRSEIKKETKLFFPEDESSLPRLNKYIANAGICSRREADDLITAGAISVNGKIITDFGTRVKVTDVVSYGGQSIRKEKPVYILLNKPKNYITTSDDPEERKTVLELIKGACKERVYPVGRLDRNTTGLLILTNDGDLTKILTHPRYEKKKIYHVSLDKPLTKEDLTTIAGGIELEDGLITVDEISYVTGEPKTEIGIEIHSGKNRIVRRIFEHVGYAVKRLDRVFFAGLTKKDLPRGRWRFLTERELVMLKSK